MRGGARTGKPGLLPSWSPLSRSSSGGGRGFIENATVKRESSEVEKEAALPLLLFHHAPPRTPRKKRLLFQRSSNQIHPICRTAVLICHGREGRREG